MQTDDSLKKSLMLGKIEGRGEERVRGWDDWMASPIQWTWTWANSGRWWGTGRLDVLPSTGSWRVRHDWATEEQQIWLMVFWSFLVRIISNVLLWTLLCMYFSEPHIHCGWEYALRWNHWLTGYAFFQFYKALLNCSTEGLYQFTLPQTLPFNKSL